MGNSRQRKPSSESVKGVERRSEDLGARRVEELRRCFPEAFVEGKVDFERLRAALGAIVEEGPERYTFTWAGKRDALRLLQMPTRATLLPCPEESVDWETTQNVFIEGENLEVLKLLLRPYYGRVKMIYIDPPYNTGNDFIYNDDYRDPLGAYLRMTGQTDDAGNLLTSNPETSGRYHSAWLNMIYPRLFLARQLLREDGVIFVSIDDHEVHNLRLIMNEIFGEENFVSLIVWVSNLKGRQIAETGPVGTHEYILCFARSASAVDQFRADIRALKQLMPDIYKSANWEVKCDERGPYVTKNELYNTNSAFNEVTAPTMVFNIHHNFTTGETRVTDVDDPTTYEGFAVARPHPNARPGLRYHAWRWSREKVIRDASELEFRLVNGELRIWTKVRDVGSMAMKDVILGPSTETGQKDLEEIRLDRAFDTPKPVSVIKLLLSASSTKGSISMDFFAGSCTTAQAVLELNREDGGNRRFIMVQLPEPTPDGSVARQAGFETIAEIGKERIRRVIARMKEQNVGRTELPEGETPEDLGFRVYKLAPSNYRSWGGVDAEGDESPPPETYVKQMELFIDPLLDGWTPEGVIAEVALKEAGFGLNYKVEIVGGLKRQKVYRITDPDRDQFFYLCLDCPVP